METIYLIFISVLFILAISDLIVGVSNDAVNFLNSAVGSKAATLKVVMFVAAIGVFAGTVFSGGMMEIARSGIFNPARFSFADIMLIFLAVMITDVILIDAFNTIGFPTSTTVSLIFELLGASVAIATIKIAGGGEYGQLGDYINSAKALAVVSGILVSVLIAFTVGTFVQWVTRLLFTFDYERKIRVFGGLYGGIAITIIVYFILIKGAKDAAFMTASNYLWVKENSISIIIVSFAAITSLLYLLTLLFRINILKVVVLVGTFALAMAFAGNDLVNFIGVPLAGYDAYLTYSNSVGANPESLTMESLSGAVKTPYFFLLLSGFIMVVTLYKSKKARTVIMTEVNLSRQDEGDERFGSSGLSRGIVRFSLGISSFMSSILPQSTKTWISRRFEPLPRKKKEKNQPAFDLLRASVNLVVSSALIALGTSLKLPLSTTYVTFMVAMGTSLSDGAWDRESAVYRITGVFSVIGGWFFTAISAFTISFILAGLFHFGGSVAIFVMILLAIFLAIRTHKMHLKKDEKIKSASMKEAGVHAENLIEFCSTKADELFAKTNESYAQLLQHFEKKNPGKLKKTQESLLVLVKDVKDHRKIAVQMIKGTEQINVAAAHAAISSLDNMLEVLNSLGIVANAFIKHQSNHHKAFSEQQITELRMIHENLAQLLELRRKSFSSMPPSAEDETLLKSKTENNIEKSSLNEILRMQEGSTGNRSSMLFMNLLQETKNILYFTSQVEKSITTNRPGS